MQGRFTRGGGEFPVSQRRGNSQAEPGVSGPGVLPGVQDEENPGGSGGIQRFLCMVTVGISAESRVLMSTPDSGRRRGCAFNSRSAPVRHCIPPHLRYPYASGGGHEGAGAARQVRRPGPRCPSPDGGVAELADATDSKSVGVTPVRVQFPPPLSSREGGDSKCSLARAAATAGDWSSKGDSGSAVAARPRSLRFRIPTPSGEKKEYGPGTDTH